MDIVFESGEDFDWDLFEDKDTEYHFNPYYNFMKVRYKNFYSYAEQRR